MKRCVTQLQVKNNSKGQKEKEKNSGMAQPGVALVCHENPAENIFSTDLPFLVLYG
ncbi:MAG: hypothetical protein ACK518_03275 [bacterium]